MANSIFKRHTLKEIKKFILESLLMLAARTIPGGFLFRASRPNCSAPDTQPRRVPLSHTVIYLFPSYRPISNSCSANRLPLHYRTTFPIRLPVSYANIRRFAISDPRWRVICKSYLFNERPEVLRPPFLFVCRVHLNGFRGLFV